MLEYRQAEYFAAAKGLYHCGEKPHHERRIPWNGSTCLGRLDVAA
jgi:hypothetical protein